MHMVDKVDLTPEEQETFTVSNKPKSVCSQFRTKPTTVFAADGTIRTTLQATVRVKYLDMFVTVQLLKDSPAVFSFGKVCEEHGYSCEKKESQPPNFDKNGNVSPCTSDNVVPIVAPVSSKKTK